MNNQETFSSFSRRWSPKIETPLEDIEGQCTDIVDAYEFFKRFIKEVSSSNLDFILLDALATAAVIRYARPFVTGDRHRLHIDYLPAVSQTEVTLHEQLMEIRSKYVAHPVNEQETHAIYVSCNLNSSAEDITVTSISSGTLRQTAISVDLACSAKALCIRWSDWLNEKRDIETKRLLTYAQSLTSAEILALPKGPKQISDNPYSRRSRQKVSIKTRIK